MVALTLVPGNLGVLGTYPAPTSAPLPIGTAVTTLFSVSIPGVGLGPLNVWHMAQGGQLTNGGTSIVSVNISVQVDGGPAQAVELWSLGATATAAATVPVHLVTSVTLDTSAQHTLTFVATGSATGVDLETTGPGLIFFPFSGPI